MDVIVQRPAALDVHKEQVTACVRFPAPDGARAHDVREFKTTVGGLLVLHDWLKAHGVTQVAMEATGVYWKPVWAVLEDSFDCLLVNARHVKQVPGRKTDVKDAEWLCQLLEAGLLRRSFVPPKPIRQLRNFTRYRKAQIKERQREANRLHKALEDTGIKLDCVASDILGVSGRAMLDALCAGTTDPEVLAELAKGRLRAKLPALREALEGRFDAQHALLIGAILAHLDFLDEQIERLSDAIEEQLRPFQPAVDLLRTLGGIEVRTAQNILAEIGTDMSVFPSAGHCASWAGQCSGNDQSAGKRRSGRTRKGSKWLNDALKDAAIAAIRTNDSYLQAQYQRLRPRIGHGRALGAVKHSILCAIWHMLSTGELYRDLGGDYFRKRDPERQTKRLIAQLERLGHKVTLEALQQAA
ncbi:MAG TPA: IS110 family transposase [Kofleriaceae bacterium]|nr:IS110 family transposase [Kofleriaceae bacterium]